MPVKHLTVFHRGGTWYGQEVNWKRSGSGSYREVAGIVVPQSREEIEAFAAERDYIVEWRGPMPEQRAPAPSP